MQDPFKEHIMKQRYLYRGTNTFSFDSRKQNGFYYGTYSSNREEAYLTSTSVLLLRAMVIGVGRIETDFSHMPDVRPVLVAIQTDRYIDAMRPGLEGTEVEIVEKINFDDVVVIGTLEILKRIKPEVTNVEIEYFRDNYERSKKSE